MSTSILSPVSINNQLGSKKQGCMTLTISGTSRDRKVFRDIETYCTYIYTYV